MSHKQKIATIFGGTGFIGRQIVRELAALGYTIKVATRIPESAYFLKPCGTVGQVVPVACDIQNNDNVLHAMQGADVVVNCIGILYEKKKGDFEKIHTDFPGRLASLCQKNNVQRFVHISALACERAESEYAKTKRAGEVAVSKAFPQATILRPSVVFGPEDNFFNQFARLARFFPALPLIGGGKTKFQPVFVGDVANAVIKAITLHDSCDQTPLGKIYELGGTEIVSFEDVYHRLFKHTKRKRILLPLPWKLAKLKAMAMSLLPTPLLTTDQVESLKTDNICNENALTLKDLGITPTSMSLILPQYLSYYRPGGIFGTTNQTL